MTDRHSIQNNMDVVTSDGAVIGQVSGMEGENIRLLEVDPVGPGGPRMLPINWVDRVDNRVHLNKSRADALAFLQGGTETTTLRGAREVHVSDEPSRMGWLPWLLLLLGLGALLLFLLRQCDDDRARGTSNTVVENRVTDNTLVTDTTTTNTVGGDTSSTTVRTTRDLGAFVQGTTTVPQTFTFDRLNFDTGSAAIRAVDRPEIEDVARVMSTNTNARIRIVGYTDASGATTANAQLGRQRAEAVVAALAARGVDRGRMEAASGGEADPVAPNARSGGRAENRRTELVLLSR